VEELAVLAVVRSSGSGSWMVASPVHELAMELQAGVYIAGEVIGGALLLWDWARQSPKATFHIANNCRANYVNMSDIFSMPG